MSCPKWLKIHVTVVLSSDASRRIHLRDIIHLYVGHDTYKYVHSKSSIHKIPAKSHVQMSLVWHMDSESSWVWTRMCHDCGHKYVHRWNLVMSHTWISKTHHENSRKVSHINESCLMCQEHLESMRQTRLIYTWDFAGIFKMSLVWHMDSESSWHIRVHSRSIFRRYINILRR